jgi:hypothetical protein
VVEKDGEFLPIEVKSGKDYERHRALCNVMENEEYAVPHAFVLCLDNVQVNGGLFAHLHADVHASVKGRGCDLQIPT